MRQAHRRDQRVGVMDAHRMTHGREQTAGEELNPLCLVKPAGPGKEVLETVGVLLDGAGAAALGELEQRGGAEGWTEALVEEVLELALGRSAIILFKLVVPQLCDVVQMERRHPNAFLPYGAMVEEILLTFVDVEHGVDGAIKAGKVPLFVLEEWILIAIAIRTMAAAGSRRRRGLVHWCRHVRLEGTDHRLERIQFGNHVGYGWFSHGSGGVLRRRRQVVGG